MSVQPYLKCFNELASSLTAKFSATFPGHPEDQLKGPVSQLLKDIGECQGATILIKTESRVEDLGAIPDMGVARDELLTGHVELKKPGVGAKVSRFQKRNREQWEKYKELPNLLYTDGNEWGLYRFGEEVQFVRLVGDITQDGVNAFGDRDITELTTLLTNFLFWEPVSPRSVKELASVLAPLCRLLREEVMEALDEDGSAINRQKATWVQTLFPNADDAQFADAYAQTITYGLLLAKLETQTRLTIESAADGLRAGHALLGQALKILGQARARKELELSLSLLERQISAINIELVSRITDTEYDPWVYFYEDFLAEYNPQLRKNRGVYYTPFQVVNAQVNLTEDLLKNRLGKDLGLGTEDVVILDPAAGTGTYPLIICNHVIRQVREQYGEGAVPQFATQLAQNLYAFELLVGPYTVSHLRITEFLKAAGGTMPEGGVQVFLTDTLDSPAPATPVQQFPLFHEQLAIEHERAQKVKAETPILVCLGNPPYDREQREYDPTATNKEKRKGGWVRYGDPENPEKGGILEDFLNPVRESGQGLHLKNLYNDYVYFWRWALWKVFEQGEGPGICTFITASSYINGPGFAGMRQHMRKVLDELWILDLGGSQLGARTSENVFDIRTPVAIAIGLRAGDLPSEEPAKVHYFKVQGDRVEKLNFLDSIEKLSDVEWLPAKTGWMDEFLPEASGDFATWPLLTDLFPWQHSGAQFKRTWPISSQQSVLHERWKGLLNSPNLKTAFRETRDRCVERGRESIRPGEKKLPALKSLSKNTNTPPIVRYGYRSFDRQWAIEDSRLGDYLRPQLWMAHSEHQLYLSSLLTKRLGTGPSLTVSAHRPDLDYFCNRGGKDVIPLWREPAAEEANITLGLLAKLQEHFGQMVSAEDFFAYCYAMLASPGYAAEFEEELDISRPRVPITTDGALFSDAVEFGNQLIFLHTYGERFSSRVMEGAQIHGSARNTKAVMGESDDYPDEFSYDAASETLHVGDGEFAPVAQQIWEFSVSGLQILHSWLAYRMRSGAGRKSSPLDEIRPTQWTAQMTRELLELLWVLEASLGLYPDLDALRANIQSGEVFTADELPEPNDEQRKPKKRSELQEIQVELL